MSQYHHTAIVVTGFEFDNEIHEAYRQAAALQLTPTPIMWGRNAVGSFMVPPSGASHGGSVAEHDVRIFAFVQWLKRFARTRLDWVEVKFGREFGPSIVMSDEVGHGSRREPPKT